MREVLGVVTVISIVVLLYLSQPEGRAFARALCLYFYYTPCFYRITHLRWPAWVYRRFRRDYGPPRSPHKELLLLHLKRMRVYGQVVSNQEMSELLDCPMFTCRNCQRRQTRIPDGSYLRYKRKIAVRGQLYRVCRTCEMFHVGHLADWTSRFRVQHARSMEELKPEDTSREAIAAAFRLRQLFWQAVARRVR